MSSRRLLLAVALLPFCAVIAHAAGPDEDATALTRLASGRTGSVAYSLYRIGVPSGKECDLLLVLRNVGAKHIPLDDIQSKHFKLRDAKFSDIRVRLRSAPQSISYESTTVAYLHAWDTGDHPAPWTLSFSAPTNFTLNEPQLQITGIDPAKRAVSGQ